ncbi:MAG: hypothetical protein R2706_15815 [Acidimicrobiales bacterium]
MAHGDLALLGEEGAHLPRELVEEVVGASGVLAQPRLRPLSSWRSMTNCQWPSLFLPCRLGENPSFAERSLRASGFVSPSNRLIRSLRAVLPPT